ncbi:cytochrome bd oxidase small subunit CydS [Ectobacillus antri]|jgi:hypothetical protein
MHEFLLFYAPFLIVIAAAAASFWIAAQGGKVEEIE